MIQVETELLAALYVLYLHEAVFWMAGKDRAWTRRADGGWTPHEAGAKSFTLLGHRPVPADLLLLRPGFLADRECFSAEAGASETASARARKRVARRLDSLKSLRTQCRLQGLLLLAVLPWVLLRHAPPRVWFAYGATLALSHALLVFSTWELLAKDGARGRVLAPILLNPLGAVRVLDPLADLWYRRFLKPTQQLLTPPANVH
jgi:hypothetical protein